MVEDDTPVKEAGTIAVQVEVDGNMYTATLENGRAVIKVDLMLTTKLKFRLAENIIRKLKK